jgi:hypothetical protein
VEARQPASQAASAPVPKPIKARRERGRACPDPGRGACPGLSVKLLECLKVTVFSLGYTRGYCTTSAQGRNHFLLYAGALGQGVFWFNVAVPRVPEE